MKKTLLALSLVALACGPAMAGNWTVTGNNGGTTSGSRSCDRSTSGASCTVNGTATTAGGKSVDRQRVRTTGAGGTTVTGGVTGPNGQQRGYVAKISR